MADFNRNITDYSSSDFTGLADYYMQKLGRRFQCLHSKEEYDILMAQLIDRIALVDEKESFDSKTQMLFTDIVAIFNAVCPERDELKRFIDDPSRIMLTPSNKNEVFADFEILSRALKSQKEIDIAFLNEVKEMFYYYKSFKDSRDFMRRLVIRRLRKISPEFVCEFDPNNPDEFMKKEDGSDPKEFKLRSDIDEISTRLLILKQLLKQFGWCDGIRNSPKHPESQYQNYELKKIIDKEFNGDWQIAAQDIQEDIFDQFAIKKGGNDVYSCKIIALADGFGKAFFDDNGRTREELYVFAIAFEMKWHSTDESVDIAKNLYYDFYSAGLVNEISRSKGSVKSVSGYGINYKNFLEVCYLYSLTRDIPDDVQFSENTLSPALYRFQRARRMIDECKNNGKSWDDDEIQGDFDLTRVYVESFFDGIDRLSEEDFTKYVENRYMCRDSDSIKTKDKDVKFAMQNRTANVVYESLLYKIPAEEKEKTDFSGFLTLFSRKEKKGTDKVELSILDASDVKVAIQNGKDIYYSDGELFEYRNMNDADRDFVVLLSKFGELLRGENSNANKDYQNGMDKNGYLESEPINVYKRSDIIVVAFRRLVYYYSKFPNRIPVSRMNNFMNFYDFFSFDIRFNFKSYNIETTGLSGLLQECGFMGISPKDMFDLLMFYSAYKRIKEILLINKVSGGLQK